MQGTRISWVENLENRKIHAMLQYDIEAIQKSN
jgi:hypothetical protein